MNVCEELQQSALGRYPPAEILEAPLAFPSAKSGAAPLLVNNSDYNIHILKAPSLAEIETVIANCERIWLRIIWQKHVLEDPDNAIATNGSHTVLRRGYILKCCGATITSRSAAIQASQLARTPLPRTLEEKRALFSKVPENADEARLCFTKNFWLRRVRIPELLPAKTAIADAQVWLKSFFGLMRHNRAVDFSAAFLRITACRLAYRGWVLFPIKVASSLEGGCFCRDGIAETEEYAAYYLPEQIERMLLLAPVDATAIEKVFARVCIFCTTLRHESEVTWDYAEAMLRVIRVATKRKVDAAAWARLKEMARVNGGPTLVAKFQDPFMAKIEALCRISGRGMESWISAFESYRPTLNVKYIGGKAARFSYVIKWLASLETIPKPLEITRSHIRNDLDTQAPTFLNFLYNYRYQKRTGEQQLGVSIRNATMSELAIFLDWLAAKERSINPNFSYIQPIRIEVDRFKRVKGTALESTYRNRIHSYILVELQKMLVTPSADGFQWTEWVQKDCQVRVGADGAYRFCPIYPAILYLMLRFPLRAHQVRELDSGELDERRFDFAIRKFVPNPIGIKDREAGVLIPSLDGRKKGEHLQLDFQVYTNKRLLEHARRAFYTIPFVDDGIEWVIHSVIAWQEQWGAKPMLINLADDPNGKFNTAQDATARAQLPEICPLFRHPEQRGLFAPSHSTISRFWYRLCARWDEQNKAFIDPITGETGRPDVPQLSEIREYKSSTSKGGKFESVYAVNDLHSLRVSGISTLIDLDIPIESVSAIAGHGSGWIMTLHYYKHDRAAQRALLGETLKDEKYQALFESIQSKLKETKEWNGFFIGSEIALEYLKKKGKMFTLSATGICPGASCADGIPATKAGGSTYHVPGARCEMCQFRVYGPAFLPGLIQQLNLLLYAVAEAGKKQREIREKIDVAIGSGRRDLVIELRSLDEELDREMELDIVHMARTAEIVRECKALLSDAKGNPMALLSLSDGDQMALIMEPVREFEQLKDIILTADIIKTKSRVPDQALMKMKDRLITILIQNGAQPFLAGLSTELTKRASLLFAEILQKVIPITDSLEKLFAGEISLTGLPGAEEPIKKAAELISSNLRNFARHHEFEKNPALMLSHSTASNTTVPTLL